MKTMPYDKDIVGDLAQAHLILQVLSQDEGESSWSDALTEKPGEQDDLLRGLGTVINIYMAMFGPTGILKLCCESEEDPEPDLIHMVVPAVVTKIADALPGAPEAIPMVAGALTCAALGDNCYEWRRPLGPWSTGDILSWTYAAYFLSDLVDFSLVDTGTGERGFALDFLAEVAGSPTSPPLQ